MQTFQPKYWIKFSFLNLLIVAFLGVLMRYKIGFEFPYFDQKHLQHAHSHFAFSGWVAHTLFTLMVSFLYTEIKHLSTATWYNRLIISNLICSYGMLFSFAAQGYGFVSIIFSTASILISFAFTYFYLKDLKQIADSHPSKNWFKAALLFNVVSTAGTLALAYMMATKNLPQHLYLGSVYFYLHFQYNGWFFFACMGLFLAYLYRINPNLKFPNQVFFLFASSCIPAYFLSTLWANLPVWLYVLVIIAAFAQVIAWAKWLIFIKENILFLKERLSTLVKNLLFLVLIGVSIKLLLQLGSTIPAISKLAFGFRPIVIAYLHLVLLGIISVFILTYVLTMEYIEITKKWAIRGLLVFVLSVFLIEIILAVQGVASFSYTLIPYSNEILLGVTVLLFIGLVILLKTQVLLKKSH